jgi:hypothetical protein
MSGRYAIKNRAETDANNERQIGDQVVGKSTLSDQNFEAETLTLGAAFSGISVPKTSPAAAPLKAQSGAIHERGFSKRIDALSDQKSARCAHENRPKNRRIRCAKTSGK